MSFLTTRAGIGTPPISLDMPLYNQVLEQLANQGVTGYMAITLNCTMSIALLWRLS